MPAASTSRLQARKKAMGDARGLTTGSDITARSYIIWAEPCSYVVRQPSRGDFVGEQADGEREEVRLIPAQNGTEILAGDEGRAIGAGRPHDALALPRRRARRHFLAPRKARPP